MRVPMPVLPVERPFHVCELHHTPRVEVGPTALVSRNIPTVERFLACLLRLATPEKSPSTILLVLHTLREYVSHNSKLPHSMIAEVC